MVQWKKSLINMLDRGACMRMKEIEQKTGLTRHTLRYYEKIGLLQNVARDKNGLRVYSEDDLGWIQFLVKMKLTRMPLEELKIYADSYYTKEPDVDTRIEVLKKHKMKMLKELSELDETLKFIDCKIGYYEDFKKNKEENAS